MTEIEELLRLGKSALDELVTPISEAELLAVETSLPFQLPASYREFVALGGLRELRINHRVLSPSEIREALQHVDQCLYLPFADNGCGDLYCWRKSTEAEPPVFFADHESSEYVRDTGSFTEWLRKNRF
ncbi:MAG: hypothetical protein CVU22_12360 [Betaproteobacteria bacterium HGW-Betaproteobacteria-16]|nr:MAG: hypothetical protein CVU22_12360 [Betaproteobacteria bacterium HGW-Betaproteobacteria-16]